MKPITSAALIALLFCLWKYATPCNETVCAPIVSKCMLTQSCKCDLNNVTCSKECFICLDTLYSECCSCVEMCPKPNRTESSLSEKSHVEDLPEPMPQLFDVLTEEKDRFLRWTSYVFPAHISFVSASGDVEIKYTIESSGKNITDKDVKIVNCSVAYMSQCMSWNKCKTSCQSMGASSYRWFHDGCCECAGSTCLNYGINESRCLECPLEKDEMGLDSEEEIVIENPEKEVPAADIEEYEGYEDEEEINEEQELHEKLPPSKTHHHS